MAITATYVTSVNGKTGDLPWELDYVTDPEGDGDYNQEFGPVTHQHRNLKLDANDFRVNGISGNTIPQGIQGLASTMRPLLLEQIEGTDDYVMLVESGIPYEPVSE